jgi:hypothetical protein
MIRAVVAGIAAAPRAVSEARKRAGRILFIFFTGRLSGGYR